MSGVEIAGLVLGSFPVLLHALHSWSKITQGLKDWWQIKREYRKCINAIEYQKLRYESNLEECLLPLIVDKEQLSALMDDAGGKSWKEPNLESKLKTRLSERVYKLYLATIQEMKEAVFELQGRAQKIEFEDLLMHDDEPMSRIPIPSSLAQRGKAKAIFEARRISYSFDKHTRTRLLNDVDVYNTRLKDLLAISDSSNALRGTSSQVATQNHANKVMLQFWRHANSVFELLADAWCCSCKELHHTLLLLQHRTSNDFRLQIGYFFDPQEATSAYTPWTWKETEVKKLEDQNSTASVKNSLPRPSAQSKKKQHLTIPDATRLPPSAFRNQTNVILGAKTSFSNSSARLPLIKDLCSIFATSEATCFGCLQGDSCLYVVSPIAGKNSAWSTISLQSVLNLDNGKALNRRQRYSIALTLVSSHLQLHSSHWLKVEWAKANIIFPLDDTSRPIAEKAYLSKGSSVSPTPENSSTNLTDRTFITLGVILLELCFGIAFEDTAERQRSIPQKGPNFFSDLGAAFEWSTRVVGEAGPEYAEAVTWCLSKGILPVKEGNWRKELLEKVIWPLEHCYSSLT